MAYQAEKHSRRNFLKYGIAAIALGVAAIAGVKALKREQKPSHLESSLEINFENSVRHPEIRQKYLDKLFEQRFRENDEAWLSIAEFVYDPNLERIKRHGPVRQCVYEKSIPGSVEVIITPDGPNIRGKEVPIYFTEYAFKRGFVESEDELKSMIDHESAHALFVHKGTIQFPYVPELMQLGLLPAEIQAKIFESLAFEKQILTYAGLKKRIVGLNFDRDKYSTYRQINHEIEEYAIANPEHGRIMFPILNTLRVIPKKQ